MQHRITAKKSEAPAISRSARAAKPAHAATLTTQSKAAPTDKETRPIASLARVTKSPHQATVKTPKRQSHRPNAPRNGRPPSTATSAVPHADLAEQIHRLEHGGDSRTLSQQLSCVSLDDVRAVAERFADSTNWHTSGQVQWLRREELLADAKRVFQVCLLRAARELKMTFQTFELPADTRLGTDWQALTRLSNARVLELTVRTAP